MRTTITMGSLALCFVATLATPASARHRHHVRHVQGPQQHVSEFQPFMFGLTPDAATKKSNRRSRREPVQATFGGPSLGAVPDIAAIQPYPIEQSPRRTRRVAADTVTDRHSRRSQQQSVQAFNGPMYGPTYDAVAVEPSHRSRRQPEPATFSGPMFGATPDASPEAAAIQPRRARRQLSSMASNSMAMTGAAGYGGSSLVSEARRWIGGNPTGRSSLWCGNFMNFVLERTGHHASPSNTALSFASYGHRLSGPQVGAIAVLTRRGGGHVGVVSGIDADGNPIIISGNHGHRVAEATYPRGRIVAYVMP